MPDVRRVRRPLPACSEGAWTNGKAGLEGRSRASAGPSAGPRAGARPGRPAIRPIASALVVLSGVLVACGTRPLSPEELSTASGSHRVIRVAAAENFWGSIARQIGGTHVRVVSIITNPNTDPHDYEPTAADARTLARSQLVIENGVGYDPWVTKLLAADQGTPTTLDVGALLRLAPGANPHRWYNPADVQRVIGQMVADYRQLDPSDGEYFVHRGNLFASVALRSYHAAIATIKASYSGTPVGASESIFAMLAPALGLDLITPPSFLKAISEGTDVSVADKEEVDKQIRSHMIKIYVYNTQNVTPDVRAELNEARVAHIPVAAISETMQPASTTFQVWQTKQLHGIRAALSRAHA